MNRVTCLVCHKLINKIHEHEESFNLQNGGFIELSFGYGSNHDQVGVYYEPFEEKSRLDQLLSCNIIRAYICDICFEKNIEIIEGYETHETFHMEKKVNATK